MDYRIKNNQLNPAASFFLNTKAKTTKQKDKYVLRFFSEFTFNESDILKTDWSQLSKTAVLHFIEHKIETIQFNTVNTYLTVLQCFARECYEQKIITLEAFSGIRSIKKYRGITQDAGRALNLREIKKVSNYLGSQKSARNMRNLAIFALALGAGLRRAEITTIDIEHIRKRELRIIGKGNKARTIYLSDFVFEAVHNWRKQLKKSKGALIVSVYQGESIKENQRLSIRAINHIIKEICNKCNIEHFTTHDLRRTFATTLLEKNNDIFTVQDLLGHSDPMTTKRYDKRHARRKTKAIESLPF